MQISGLQCNLQNKIMVRTKLRRLNERTVQEMQIYERTRRELENETSPDAWESKNEALRRIGLRTIPNPKEQE